MFHILIHAYKFHFNLETSEYVLLKIPRLMINLHRLKVSRKLKSGNASKRGLQCHPPHPPRPPPPLYCLQVLCAGAPLWRKR